MEHLLLCSQNILFVLAVALRSCAFVFILFYFCSFDFVYFGFYLLFICLVLLLALFLDNFVCYYYADLKK